MGWMASWVAVQGAAKTEVLEHLGLTETGEEVFPGSRTAAFSYREFPDSWLVVFSEKFDWANQQRLLELSRFGFALACQFEDKVEMASSLTAARDGVELWRVFHDHTGSVYRLDVTGEPPAAFGALRDAAFDEQRQDGGEDSSTDFVHDVAHDLGKAVCGYRADEEEAAFAALRTAGASLESGGGKRPGLVARLLAQLRPKP